jgi:hypothetical protein
MSSILASPAPVCVKRSPLAKVVDTDQASPESRRRRLSPLSRVAHDFVLHGEQTDFLVHSFVLITQSAFFADFFAAQPPLEVLVGVDRGDEGGRCRGAEATEGDGLQLHFPQALHHVRALVPHPLHGVGLSRQQSDR